MNGHFLALLTFLFGVGVMVAAWRLLKKLDPPKEPGETRFEGVLPNFRGLAIFGALLLFIAGAIIALIFAPIFYITE